MNMSRREMLWLGAGGLALAALPQAAAAATVDELTRSFTGGAEPAAEGVTLTAPEIAENGNTVPVSVDAPGATEILLIATGNPEPGVVTFRFGPAAGSQAAATRIRLAKTQEVIALAKMPDGRVARATANVKVTIGGCGG